jgi:ankyrin repeat protein
MSFLKRLIRPSSATLARAVMSGNLLHVEELLKSGADPNAGKGEPRAVLHDSIYKGMSVAMLELLLQGGADVDLRTSDGWTPLHAAAAAGNMEIVKRLLRAGADAGARSRQGSTPADTARTTNHHDVAEFLSQQDKEDV